MLVAILALHRSVYCDIKILSSSPSNGSVVKEGGTVSLSCETDRGWFLCLWTSPLGQKVCSIQESENGARQVCHGDHRIMGQGGATNCAITVNNVTRDDWGAWMCLVQDSVVTNSNKIKYQIHSILNTEYIQFWKMWRILKTFIS